jgi:hypothetical protein
MTTFLLCAILGCVGVFGYFRWFEPWVDRAFREAWGEARSAMRSEIRGMVHDLKIEEARRAAEKAKEN